MDKKFQIGEITLSYEGVEDIEGIENTGISRV